MSSSNLAISETLSDLILTILVVKVDIITIHFSYARNPRFKGTK